MTLSRARPGLTCNRSADQDTLFPARGQLSFIRSHCLPENFQVLLEAAIPWIPMQGTGEPSVGGGQVAGGAMSGEVHRAKHGLGFGVRMLSGRLQTLLRPTAILRNSCAVKIFLSIGN